MQIQVHRNYHNIMKISCKKICTDLYRYSLVKPLFYSTQNKPSTSDTISFLEKIGKSLFIYIFYINYYKILKIIYNIDTGSTLWVL